MFVVPNGKLVPASNGKLLVYKSVYVKESEMYISDHPSSKKNVRIVGDCSYTGSTASWKERGRILY